MKVRNRLVYDFMKEFVFGLRFVLFTGTVFLLLAGLSFGAVVFFLVGVNLGVWVKRWRYYGD